MTGINGHRYRTTTNMFIAAVDAVLILLSLFGAAFLRFSGELSLLESEHMIWRMVLVVLLIELVFYYFDLYDPRMYREKKVTGILIIESLGGSAILLSLIYYMAPVLTMGRGVFAVSLMLIFFFTFGWRIFFQWISRARTFKERILIVGTGELAKKIKKELIENGHDGFEIVGFVDESRERIGERI